MTTATKPTLRQRAQAWMDEHPEAMSHFRAFAEDMRSRGRRFGIGQLTERVRWEMAMRGADGDFKVNNSFRAMISRRLIADDPRLADLIQCRVMKAADKPARQAVPAAVVDPLTEVVR